MQRPVLNEEDEYPDDAVLARHLGKAKLVWDEFCGNIVHHLPDASLEWRYYNDGRAWLCRLTHKKKTACWISIWDQFFKASFYFTQKNDAAIELLPISSQSKAAYCVHEATGKLKPVVVTVRTSARQFS